MSWIIEPRSRLCSALGLALGSQKFFRDCGGTDGSNPLPSSGESANHRFLAGADRGDEDLFVHISAIERSGLTGLSEGDRVIVGIAEGRKGPEAARVRLV